MGVVKLEERKLGHSSSLVLSRSFTLCEEYQSGFPVSTCELSGLLVSQKLRKGMSDLNPHSVQSNRGLCPAALKSLREKTAKA